MLQAFLVKAAKDQDSNNFRAYFEGDDYYCYGVIVMAKDNNELMIILGANGSRNNSYSTADWMEKFIIEIELPNNPRWGKPVDDSFLEDYPSMIELNLEDGTGDSIDFAVHVPEELADGILQLEIQPLPTAYWKRD